MMAVVDIALYRPHIDHFDLTDEQKLDLVRAVLLIAEAILDNYLKINRLTIPPDTAETS